VFLRCQAHFSHSHRRRGLPGGPFFRRPARARIGVRGKEFRGCAEFHAPHPRRLLPLAKGSCPFEVSIPFDATWRSPASASTISYIKHSKMKTPGGRIACGALAPVYKKRFRKFRLKITMPNRREQGGRERKNASSIIQRPDGRGSHRRRPPCAPATPRIALRRRELSCRSNVA